MNDDQAPRLQESEMTQVTLDVPFPETFIYSNASAYSLTFFDLKIGFGEAMPERAIQPRVGVTVPIEHAVFIAVSLIHQLDAYERHFGPLRHPQWPLLRDALKAQKEAAKEPPGSNE